jgi:hypothetical protein
MRARPLAACLAVLSLPALAPPAQAAERGEALYPMTPLR